MPATDLEIALEKVDADTFEKLATDILSERGYEVSPTEGTGADGGRDADLQTDDETGVAHFTTRNDWQRKLREDAQKTVDRDLAQDFVVFVVNQSPEPPRVVDETADQLRGEYGFPIRILTRGDLRTQLTTQSPHLAETHLGIDSSKPITEPVEEMEQLKAERLELIHERSNALPNPLPSGPSAVLHLFPVGMFSTDYGIPPSELPNPPIFNGQRAQYLGKPVGDGVVAVNVRFGREHHNYTYLSERGYIEAVTTEPFRHGTVDAFDSPEPDTVEPTIDNILMRLFPESLNALADLGAEPPVYAFISLLDVEDYEFPSSLHGNGLQMTPRPFSERVQPKHSVLETMEDSGQGLQPSLDRLWQRAGREQGSPQFANDA